MDASANTTMSIDNTIKAYFVTSTSKLSSKDEEEFQTTMALLSEHLSDQHIRTIKASEGFPLIASGCLTKKDVFILNKFDGTFFEQLQKTKSLIVGVRCLRQCLQNCDPIPMGSKPVYTTSMRDLHVCATGINADEKEQLSRLVFWMGGYYYNNFGASITHLISNTIKSTKYEQATLIGIPVMHVDWVQRVWDRSCVVDVVATDDEFKKYHLPIFFGTNITSSGLNAERRNEVMRLVNENGGTYYRDFRSQIVDIVITEKNKTNTEKYKAALRYRKDVLIPEWIFDSVEKGFALPTKRYQVKTLKISTPTKEDQTMADFLPTDTTTTTDISRISVMNSRNLIEEVTINDTMNDTEMSKKLTTPTTARSLQREVLKRTLIKDNYRLVYNEICPKAAKKAGNFLDGCCIYLSGFLTKEKEKLHRILNVGGAMRYDAVNEKVTHIIVGDTDENQLKTWQGDGILGNVNVVHLEWLLESIKLKQAASEMPYRVALPGTSEPDAPSPSSKRTLLSMNDSFKKPMATIRKKLFNANANTDAMEDEPATVEKPLQLAADEEHLLLHYSDANRGPPTIPQVRSKESTLIASHDVPKQLEVSKDATLKNCNPIEITETAVSTINYANLNFFDGMSVYVDKEHFPDEFFTQMVYECEAAQGNMVTESFRDRVDYAIVSFECTTDEADLPVNARHVVTELYVETCMKQNKLMPIEYYHRAIPHTADAKPLSGMTIVVSIYTGLERDYIESVAQLLGANVNKAFVKKEVPLLVCPTAEGSKYHGALKWGCPIVVSEWLVQCAREGVKLPYKDYLVGESIEDFAMVAKTPARLKGGQNTTPLRDINTPQNNAINVTRPNSASSSGAAVAASNVDVDIEITPLRNKRVTELAGSGSVTRSSAGSHDSPIDISPVDGANESPHTPQQHSYLRPSYNFEFLEGMLNEIEDEGQRNSLREIIEEMRNNQTPELERIRRQACTPVNRKIPTPKGIPEFCTTPAFEKRMDDYFERRWRLPREKIKPDTPLDQIRQRVLRITCESLGIPFNLENSAQRSPLKSRDKMISGDADGGRGGSSSSGSGGGGGGGACAVGDGSDATSLQHKTPVPQQATARAIFTPPTRMSPTTITTSDTMIPETQTPNRSGRTSDNKRPTSVETTTPMEMAQISDYLRNCQSRRENSKHGSTLRSSEWTDEMQPTDRDDDADASHAVPFFATEQFGGGTEEMIEWRDPQEFSTSRRRPSITTMQHQGTPRFSISCSDKALLAKLVSRIQCLGGEVCDNLINFDPACTHYICERPNRGEKSLGCIASGKWVLSLKYIEECSAKGRFIDEELYEWGNGKGCNLPLLQPDEMVIATAAHRWRKQLSTVDESTTQRVGAFHGIRAIVKTSPQYIDALKNVIKAGDGEVIEAEPPYSTSSVAKLATHCFVDIKKSSITPADVIYLTSNGVKVFKSMYINSYLMNGRDTDVSIFKINP